MREHHCPTKMAPLADLACVNGMAGPWPCRGVDLLSFVPLEQLGSEMDASDMYVVFVSWGTEKKRQERKKERERESEREEEKEEDDDDDVHEEDEEGKRN